MGTLASLDVNVKVDQKTTIIIGIVIFVAVLLAVVIAKRI